MSIPYVKQKLNERIRPTVDAKEPDKKKTAVVAVVVLTLGALMFMPTGTAQAPCSPFEDFEDDTLHLDPTGCWYTTAASGGARVVSDIQAFSGTKSLRHTGAQTTSFEFTSEFDNLVCNPNSPGATTGYTGNFYISTAGNNAEIGTGRAGSSFTFARGTAGGSAVLVFDNPPVGFTVPSLTITEDSWWNVQLTFGPVPGELPSPTPCDGGPTRVCAIFERLTGGVSGGAVCADLSRAGVLANGNYNVIATVSTATETYFDDLGLIGAGSEVSLSGPSISVVGLRGFDVDASGTIAIARTHDAESNTEDNVRTWAAGTLATPGNVVDSDCDRFHGVAALRNYVAFLECNDGTPSDVDFLKIKNADLGDPDLPGFCSEGIDFCTGDLDANELAGDNSDQYEIASVEEIPFDFTVCNNPPDNAECLDEGGRDAIYFAFASTFIDGYVGVITYTLNRGADDTSQITRTLLNAGSIPDQLCTVRDSGDGQSYLYVADSEANVKGFTLGFDKQPGSSVPGDGATLAVQMVESFSGTASTAGARGVACGEERFAILNADKLTVWERGASTPYLTKTGLTSVPERGIAMSGDGQWVAYASGGNFNVLCITVGGCPATDFRDAVAFGANVAEEPLPGGTFNTMQLNGPASAGWVATTTTIQLYNNLYQATSGNDTACNPGDVGCGPGPEPTPDPDEPGGGFGGGGLLDLAADVAVYTAIAIILGFAVVAWALTGAKQKRGDEF